MPDLSRFAALAARTGNGPAAPLAGGRSRAGGGTERDALTDAFEERAAILTFDAGLSVAEAERRAGFEVFGRARQ